MSDSMSYLRGSHTQTRLECLKIFYENPTVCVEAISEFIKESANPKEMTSEVFDLGPLIGLGVFVAVGFGLWQLFKTDRDPKTPPKPKTFSSNKGLGRETQAQSTPSVLRKAFRHGLCNIGNTCYMGSVLQCLFHLPVFTNYFTEEVFEPENKQRTKTLAYTFYSLATKTRGKEFSKKEQKFYLSQLKSHLAIINPSFSSHKQQDALECLKTILEGIGRELNRVSKARPYRQLPTQITTSLQDLSNEWFEDVLAKENSIVTDAFYGQILNKTACKKCQKRKLSFDTFSSLSLCFNESRQGQEYYLEDMLQHFLEEEDIKGKVYCKKCDKEKNQITKSCLWRLPKILVIHFKRFKIEDDEFVKIQNHVSFPVKDLNLKSMIGDSTDPSAADYKYTLCGVINHFGTLNNGHYTANCMDEFDKKWYQFNDSNVESMRQDKERERSKDAYILFYVKTSSLNRSI